MTCDRFLLLLDEMDNDILPPEMVAHMHTCDACAGEVAVLAKALGLHRMPDSTDAVDLAPRFLECATGLPVPRRSVSMRDWLLAGVVIVLSVAMMPMLEGFRELRATFGSGFTLPVALVFGLAVTLYAGLFILSHLEDFSTRCRMFEANHPGRAA
jgi:hypothetical protein